MLCVVFELNRLLIDLLYERQVLFFLSPVTTGVTDNFGCNCAHMV